MIFSKVEAGQSQDDSLSEGLSEVIALVGSDRLQKRFSELIFQGFKISEFLVFQYLEPAGPPTILLSDGFDKAARTRARSYRNGFYRLDPIYTVLNEGSPDGSYSFRVSAGDIANAAFRDVCYARSRICEKLTIAKKQDGEIIAISFFAHKETGGFEVAQIERLNQFGNMLLSVMALHYRLVGSSERQSRVSAEQMEACVASTFPELTGREIAVCARSVLGVTSEGIALDLGIGQTSVLTYRRRAYARLNISSINQLATMLIQSSAARQLAAV